MKQMLGKRVIRHVLSDQQPLVAVTTVTNQVRQPPVPQLSNSPRLLLKKSSQFENYNKKERKINFNRAQMNTESKKEAHSELLGIRPGHLRELLHRDPPPILQPPFVHEIGRLLAAL